MQSINNNMKLYKKLLFTFIRVQAPAIQMFFYILQINISMQSEATADVVYPQELYSVRHVQLTLDTLTRYGNLSLLILNHLLEIIPDSL